MNIVDRFISVNYSTGRGGKQPIRITCHTCVCSATSLYSWFNTPTTKASTNFYVNKDGIVERYVRDTDSAWGNSNFDSNQRSFSFETWDNRNPNDAVRTNEMYESAAQLVAYLCKTYQIPCVLVPREYATNWNVKGIDLHNYFSATKSCPAALDVNRIIERANLILNPEPIMADQLIKQYSQNLLGRTTDQQTDDFETNAWVNDGKDYGKWFDNFRQNQEVKDYNVTSYIDEQVALVNKNTLLVETVDRQAQTISDLKVETVELNKACDDKDAQIKTLNEQLTLCLAGNIKPSFTINLGFIKILFVKKQ